jgi:signal transduction histidine kinase
MASLHLNNTLSLRLLTIGYISLVCLCLQQIPSAIAGEHPLYTVLILNSYHRGYKWTDDQNAGIEAALKGSVNQNQIYVEYMDADRMVHDEDLHDLYLAYKRKYRGLEFNAVCVTDEPALRFMIDYGPRLFPGAPVAFSGIIYIDESHLKRIHNFTGVRAQPDVKANIDLILRLHPGTKNVVFINEATNEGQRLHEEFLTAMLLFPSLTVQFFEDVDTKEIFRSITKLTRDSVIFYGVFRRDKVGRVFDYREIVTLLSRNTQVPIYSPWDFNLGYGIVGGAMKAGFSQGEAAGMQVLQLLRGAEYETMPEIVKPRNQYIFDYNQLRRFNIGQDKLPENSLIVNGPETLYEKHKNLVHTVMAIFLILLTIISVLLLIIRFKRRTENQLKTSQEKLRSLGRRLAEIEEKAMKNISRELHDEVGQNLTVLGVNLNILRSIIPQKGSDLIESRISDSLTLVKQTTQKVRNLMGMLRSPVLDDYGLVAALQFYSEQYSERTGIAVQVRGPDVRPMIRARCESALFRIVQESLTNVLKHAHATEVIITVDVNNAKLHLSIEDNGQGFDQNQFRETGSQRGWGLATMSERALAVNGSFRVESSPGFGTQVIVEVPV